jgi:hypothetical protein
MSAWLCRNSMNYFFGFSDLIKVDRMGFYSPFAPPKSCWRCSSLIPAGDTFNSRGQRPRKTHPRHGPTLKESNRGDVLTISGYAVRGGPTPSGSGTNRYAVRGRCPRLFNCALAELSAEAGAARTCSLGLRLVSWGQGKAADLQNRSAATLHTRLRLENRIGDYQTACRCR